MAPIRFRRDYNLNKMSWKWDISKKRKPDTVVLLLIDMYPCQFFYSMAKVQMHECVRIKFPPFSAFPFICFGEIVAKAQSYSGLT